MTVYKYSEDQLVDKLKAYIAKTYGGHYVGDNNIQAIDLIFAAGHGKGFCVGNILKYASRYGKKKGHNKDDLMKILHYAILLLYVHETEQEKPMIKANGIIGNGFVLGTDTRQVLTESPKMIAAGSIQPIKVEDLNIEAVEPVVKSARDYACDYTYRDFEHFAYTPVDPRD